MKNPVAGGRFSFGTSVRGWGRDNRYRLRSRQVLSPARATAIPAVARPKRMPSPGPAPIDP